MLSQAEDDSHPGDTIVVTGSRADTPLRSTPASLDFISRESLETRRASFLGEALNRLPGVYMTDLGNEQHSMSIRQPLSYSAVYLYLEDGIPIRPLGLFNHNALYEMNLEGAGSLELIKGPASSLYGSNAVGGTVNFLTEAPSQTGHGRLGLHASDAGYQRGTVNVSSSHDNVGARLAGYVSRNSGGEQPYNSGEKESLSTRVDWALNAKTQLIGTASYHHLRADMPGSLFEKDFRSHRPVSYHRFTYREVQASRATLALQGDWLSAGQTTLTLYGRDNSTEQLPSYAISHNAADSRIASGRFNDNDFRSLGIDARQVAQFDWLESRLILGATLDATDNTLIEDNLTISRNPSDGRYLSYRVRDNRRDYAVTLNNRAVYGQWEWTPLTDVRAVIGARQDTIQYDFTNHKTPSAQTGAPSEVRTFSHMSPKLGAIWSPSSDRSLFINIAQGFTPPEITALYGTLAVPNLSESVFDNAEIGLRQRLSDDVGLDLTAYRLDGDNEIVSFALEPGKSEPRNAGQTRHQGLELGLNWFINEQWLLDLAAARSSHRFLRYDVSERLNFAGNAIPASPKWLGNIELTYKPQFLPGVSVALEWLHLGRYWMNNANTVPYAGHDLAHLRASYRRGAWDFWFKAQNLTDQHYAETASSTFNPNPLNPTVSPDYLPNTQNSYSAGMPRTLSLGLSYEWGER